MLIQQNIGMWFVDHLTERNVDGLSKLLRI